MTKLHDEIARLRTYLGAAAPSPEAFAGASDDTQLRVLKGRCRMWRRGPPDVLAQLDGEALAAGDPVAAHRAQMKLGAAAVHELRARLRGPTVAPDERDRLLSLLLDFLALLNAEGVNLAPVVPPELADIL